MDVDNYEIYIKRIINTADKRLANGCKPYDIIADLNLRADEVGITRLTAEQEKRVIATWENIMKTHNPQPAT